MPFIIFVGKWENMISHILNGKHASTSCRQSKVEVDRQKWEAAVDHVGIGERI